MYPKSPRGCVCGAAVSFLRGRMTVSPPRSLQSSHNSPIPHWQRVNECVCIWNQPCGRLRNRGAFAQTHSRCFNNPSESDIIDLISLLWFLNTETHINAKNNNFSSMWQFGTFDFWPQHGQQSNKIKNFVSDEMCSLFG